MECLAHIWCKNKVVLILLISVMDTKSFSCWVSESCNYIVFNYFQSFILWVFYDSERRSRSVCNSIIVINSLIIERGRLWYLPSSYKTLYRSHQWVLILLTQLVLDQRGWLLALTIRACLLWALFGVVVRACDCRRGDWIRTAGRWNDTIFSLTNIYFFDLNLF